MDIEQNRFQERSEVSDLAHITTMEELVSDRDLDGKDFYTTLLKRYRKDLTEGLREKMGYLEEDFDSGEEEFVLFSEKERIENLIEQALSQEIIKGASSLDEQALVELYQKAADEIFFIDNVPVVILDQTKYAKKDWQDTGAVNIGDDFGNIFGIVLFDDKSENSTYEIKRKELQHEFIHISNSILKEKFGLQEEDPEKAGYIWKFIDEVLAYGVNIENFKELVRENLILENIFYAGEGDQAIEEVASKWQKIFQEAIDGGERTLAKLKSFVINHVKTFEDLDVSKENIETKVRGHIFSGEGNKEDPPTLNEGEIAEDSLKIEAIRKSLMEEK